MKVDAGLIAAALPEVPAAARRLEALGYDGVFTFEGPHDPFFPLLLAAEHTERVELTTAIAVAFARNPMTLAQLAYDLQLASQGRMVLGLGTQVAPHITKRFSMPWSAPAARLREMVLAIRAIWASWHEGAPLDFRGEFYTHTLMTPMFNPGPSPFGVPRIAVAGVGPRMTEVAGEVADAFIVHPFTTPKFLAATTLPALARGAAAGGRTAGSVEVSFPAMVAVGTTDADVERARESFRMRIAFYGSTPAYRVVLDAHSWGDLQPELNRMTKSGEWSSIASLVTDEVLDEFVTSGRVDQIAGRLHDRYGALVDRIALDPPNHVDDDTWPAAIQALRTP